MEHLWTALFCTIHLCLGFLLGRSSRGRADNELAISPTLAPAVAQFQRAYGVIQPELNDLPQPLQSAIEQLKQSVAMLAEELVKEKAKSVLAADSMLSRLEAAPLSRKPANDGDSPNHAREKRQAERIGYSVPEYMALFDDDLQSLDGFEEVQCHDLSSTGVGFFLNRRLDVDTTLLITLGQQAGGVVMAAKVMYSRPIIVRGEDQYRIGCQFLRRLKGSEVADLQPALSLARKRLPSYGAVSKADV